MALAQTEARQLELADSRHRARAALTPVRTPPVRAEVVHMVRGRVRLRIAALKWDGRLADRICAYLDKQDGVLSSRAAPACSSLVVTFDPEVLDVSDLLRCLEAGLPIEPVKVHPTPTADRTPLVCGLLGLGLGLLGAPTMLTGAFLAASAVPVVARAIAGVREEHTLSADALDATAIGILAAQGNLTAAALSASLIAGGEYIRALTGRRSHGALTALLAATGRSAWLVRGRRKERVAAERLVPGDVIVLYPGELLAADGIVLRGEGLVDEKTLTGESTPVPKTKGAPVYASTILSHGQLFVTVQAVGNQTRASRIVHLLENAPLHDTRLANHARRFADRLVAPTFALAATLLALTGDVSRAVSVLIIDFVTGIRVSAPTTVLASMTAAVHGGILVKGGRALEQLATVDVLVFDKTGTLTSGEPRVTRVESFADHVESAEVLALAAAAERRLTHPAAEAIVRAAEAGTVRIPERDDGQFIVGLGVRAVVNERSILVGSGRYMQQQHVSVPEYAQQFADLAGTHGQSTVFVARDSHVIGAVCYADQCRPEARAVLHRLRERGITQFVMLTGDNSTVATVVGQELGIDRIEAEVFPEQKADLVRALQAQGHRVGVVGDGINDSPALAYADVSISLKAASEVARETADVVLHGDLHGLPDVIDLARDSMHLIQQNLAIVAIPNGIGMAMASFGLLGPVAATAINNGSNVAAALNGLRPLVGHRPARAR